MRLRSAPILRVLSAAALLPVLMVSAPADTRCSKVHVPTLCKSYTDFSVYQDDDYLCVPGHPVVVIESEAVCESMFDGSTLALRCGTSAFPLTYAGMQYMHTLGTTSNWENVLYGACSNLTYSALML